MKKSDIKMRSSGWPRRCVVAVALSVLVISGCAQCDKPAPAAAAVMVPKRQNTPVALAPPADTPKTVLDQRALDRLKAMSATLAGARAFSYHSRSVTEVPASTGQNLTVFTHADVAVQRPNKLRAEVSGDIPDFQIVYDGKTVSALDPEKNLYAVADAPGTIDEALTFLMEKSGIHFPSADVLYSNPYSVMAEGVSSAFIVGHSEVDGVACDHLALMGPGVNWEIWIDAGSTALPRRLAVTYKEVTNFPRFLLEFSDWNLHPTMARDAFLFHKPAKARRIDFAPRREGDLQQLQGSK